MIQKKQFKTIHRDISWLSFNDRVLQEACDPNVPLIERLKFLGIYSSNGDEFFRVRVAALKRLAKFKSKTKKLAGFNATKVLDEIQQKVLLQGEKFDEAYNNILRGLELNSIFIINEKQLNKEHAKFVQQYFREKILPALFPVLLDGAGKFPYLKDKTIYHFVILNKRGAKHKPKYALIEIPTNMLSRFLVLPRENKYIILIDDVIRYCLDDIFHSFDYDTIEAYTIKLTRDAELDLDTDVTKTLVRKISESVKKRKKGTPTRLVYDENMPEESLSFIIKKMKLKKEDSLLPGGRYHNFVDFMNFPSIGSPELRFKSISPLEHKDLKPFSNILKVIKQKDVMLSFPYQSYNYIIDLLREASIDPKVKEIYITLYRVAKNSNIVNALSNAIKNGKKVIAMVELQARFDEENNIIAANRLQEEGARVIHGVPGLKAHTKLLLIKRIENGKQVNYAHVGTGNFNEDSARIYCDHSILTADPRITAEVERVFHFYIDNYKTGTYRHLLVAPFFMRKKIYTYISKEIENASHKKPAYIYLKLNSLSDDDMIARLYEASQAGVKIRIIARSICSLIPGIKGMSENIEVRSLVDKYLEHSRLFIFCNEGDEKVFLSSADFMTRNLDFRSEVALPVYDSAIKQQLIDIFELQWNDNVKARIIDEKQTNKYVGVENGLTKNTIRAQDTIYEYFKKQLVKY